MAVDSRRMDRRTEATDLRLELYVRGEETRRYHVQARNGFHRIMRLLEADLPLEGHRIAAAGVVAMDRALAGWPEDAA